MTLRSKEVQHPNSPNGRTVVLRKWRQLPDGRVTTLPEKGEAYTDFAIMNLCTESKGKMRADNWARLVSLRIMVSRGELLSNEQQHRLTELVEYAKRISAGQYCEDTHSVMELEFLDGPVAKDKETRGKIARALFRLVKNPQDIGAQEIVFTREFRAKLAEEVGKILRNIGQEGSFSPEEIVAGAIGSESKALRTQVANAGRALSKHLYGKQESIIWLMYRHLSGQFIDQLHQDLTKRDQPPTIEEAREMIESAMDTVGIGTASIRDLAAGSPGSGKGGTKR